MRPSDESTGMEHILAARRQLFHAVAAYASVEDERNAAYTLDCIAHLTSQMARAAAADAAQPKVVAQ